MRDPDNNKKLHYAKFTLNPVGKEWIEHFLELGKESKKLFSQKKSELDKLIPRLYPDQITPILSYYSLIIPIAERDKLEDPFLPAYIEYIQALTLSIALEKYDYLPILGNHIESLIELTSTIFKADLQSSYEEINEDEISTSLKHIQEYIRGRTKVERDWAYPFQVANFSLDLFDPLNTKFSKVFKVSVHDLLEVFDKIEQLIISRIQKHLEVMKPVYAAKNWKEADQAYQRHVLGVDPIIRDISRHFKKHGIKSPKQKLEATLGMLSSHHDLKLPEVFTIQKSDIDSSEVWNILQQLSISFGDLSSENPSHFFMNNPVLRKPFIKAETGDLMIPCCWILAQHRIDIIESLISKNEGLLKYYLDKQLKGNFLENATYKLMRESFPTAEIYINSLIQKSGDSVTENDILVLVDHVAIIIECKSSDLSDSSKRGSLQKMKKDLNENVSHAMTQLDEFASYLQFNAGQFRLPSTRNNRINEFDTSRIKKWIKLVVTLKPLGFLGTHTPTLKKAQLLESKKDETISIISLPDLEIIMNILSMPAHKIHYLLKRKELEENFTYFGDEFDLLSLYLNTGFNVPFGKETGLALGNLSGEIHSYYGLNRLLNSEDDKPTIKTSKYWMDILNHLNERNSEGWTMITTYLLNIPYSGQLEIEKEIVSLKKEELGFKKCNYGYYRYQFLNINYVVFVFIHNSFSKEERDDTVHSILYDLKVDTGVLEYVVICFDIVRNNYPYGLIGYFGYNS